MSILAQDTIVISPATVNRIEQEIEDLRGATDCADIVQSKADLDSYDTSKLTDKAIIKVLKDESRNDAETYYRWHKDTEAFEFIGELGPYYTKAETDEKITEEKEARIAGDEALEESKQDKLTAGKNITIEKVTEAGETKTIISASEVDPSRYNYEKISDYLYYADFEADLSDENYAIQYFEDNFHNKDSVNIPLSFGACSSIRKGNFYGRNYDWYYNKNASFVIHNKAVDNKYESIGMAQTVFSDMDPETLGDKIKLIPYFMLDGINSNGVFVNNNVVPTGDLGVTTGTHSDLSGDYICQLMLPRYILDHFATATEAIEWIRDEAKIFAPRNAKTQLELHFMIGDSTKTYIVEFINNGAVITDVTNSKSAVMTNFYKQGTMYDENGHIDFDSVTNYGAGLERFNLLVDGYDSVDSIESMRNCIDLVQYTKAYTEIYTDPVAKIVNPNTWKTEWAHDYSDSTVLPHPMDLHANSPLSDYEYSGIFDVLYNMYQTRSRETGTTWQTVHSSVYDIEKQELYLKVQEGDKQYHFVYPNPSRILQNIDEEVERAKAAEAGLEESKQDKLTSGDGITINDDNVISTLWKKDTGEGSVVSVSNAANGGQAIGNFSVAEGFGTDAKGDYSHTEGQLTTTNGSCAHAEGQGTTAQGNCSHAEGMDTIAQNQSEHAEGQYNKSNKTSTTFGNAGNTIHSIGIGTGAGSLEDQDRRNAVEVMQNGDIYVNGIGDYNGKNFSEADTLQEVVNNKQDNLTIGTGLTLDDTTNTLSANVVNDVTSTSATDSLSANMGKVLQDQVTNLKNIGRFLSIWDSTTGLPTTNPEVMPYNYKTGDYYRVGTVAAEGGTNYKPNGATYTGQASTTVETEDVEIGSVYYYDGTRWMIQKSGSGGKVQDVQINGTTILDLDSGVANIPIANSSNAGVIKQYTPYNLGIGSATGYPYCLARTYAQYQAEDNASFMAHGTLENVLDNETVRADKAQTLTSTQQTQGQSNLGINTEQFVFTMASGEEVVKNIKVSA